jgi:hypothetical protein
MASKNDRQSKKKKELVRGEDSPTGFQVGRINEFATEVKNEFHILGGCRFVVG